MAFQNLTGGNGGRRSRGLPAMAEINVTPFVDVALVLLIIFMITAHVMDYGIDIQVPKTKTVATSVKERPIVGITKDGEIYLGREPVQLARLVSQIHTRYPDQNAVYIRADSKAQWDPIAQVSSTLGAAKFGISLVTEPDDNIGSGHR